jgi:S-adenosylmethionine:tRNA ribosyltransferase-isomerase
MKVTDFDFFLPKDLIAKRPLNDQTGSRLLVLHRDGTIEHKKFYDLPLYLTKGDMLIINNTKVFPARLTGLKKNGGKIDILLIRKKDGDSVWEVLSKGRFTGILKISEELQLELYDGKTAQFKYSGDFMEIVWKYGKMPLPPYIRRLPDELDKKTYQTIFAKKEGSIKKIISKGIIVRELTLHVGTGTFRTIRTEDVEKHSMDAECFEIEKELISEVRKTKASGKRIISVGTTTTRALEGYMSGQCNVISQNGMLRGHTDAFIYPGYNFGVIDSLITNFHLPRSTPLMLVSALCGLEKLMNVYKEAITRKYRFLSYGDAMLIL